MASSTSYHNYQKVINFKTIEKPPQNKNSKFRRTKNGCLCCKKRRRKCDEKKPTCGGCLKRSFECRWPDTIPLNKDETSEKEEKINNTTNEQNDFLNDDDLLNEMFNFIDNDFILDQFLDIESQKITLSDFQTEPNDPVFNLTPITEQFNIPGIELSEQDLCCYNAFLKYIDNLISYPHCHPNLTTADIILPFVESNKIVREVALACGASWLGYYDSALEIEAIRRYHNVITLIIEELKNPKSNYTDHIFVCVQLLQGLCVRNKTIGFNVTLSAAHFSSSYAVIKRRFLNNSFPMFQSGKIQLIMPLDRILMENFLIFYPINLMLCHSSKLKESVPSPFSFFSKFYHVLRDPINGYENENVWVNHPIIGTGLKAFEIATKCSWSCRFLKLPISEDDLITYFSLFIETNKELERLNKILEDPSLVPSQIESVYVTRTMLYASLIVLRKLCYYEKTTIESLRETVDILLNQEVQIAQNNARSMSSIWSLFIGASTSSTKDQKKFFSEMLKLKADQLHSSMCLKMLNYLNIVWSDEGDNCNAGFEFLFDTMVLDMISI